MTPPVRPAALVLALVLDELLGEPPTRWHPVVGMGALLRVAGPHVPAAPPAPAVLRGGAAWLVGAGLAGGAGLALERVGRRLPWPAAVLLQAGALWTLLSARLLREEVAAVEHALALSPTQGRTRVARLVSRDTTTLDEEQVRQAALGSLSENLCDSVVAPALAHALGGPAAAAVYRFTNTADAVWGYRDDRWRHAGRVAARADDVANLLPARLSGLLLTGPDPARLRRLPREAARTPSPNGGWPMGALALRLGVRLGKPGVYALNPGGRAPAPEDTAAALRLFRQATVHAVLLLGAAPTAAHLARRGHARRAARHRAERPVGDR